MFKAKVKSGKKSHQLGNKGCGERGLKASINLICKLYRIIGRLFVSSNLERISFSKLFNQTSFMDGCLNLIGAAGTSTGFSNRFG